MYTVGRFLISLSSAGTVSARGSENLINYSSHHIAAFCPAASLHSLLFPIQDLKSSIQEVCLILLWTVLTIAMPTWNMRDSKIH